MDRASVAEQAANLRAKPTKTGPDQIQTLIFSGFANLDRGRFDVLSIADPAACRAWLGRLAPEITTADVHAHDTDRAIFIAFTAAGLRALGVADEVMATFATPFREGMVTPHRSRVLGDVGRNDPSHWRWGAPQDPRPVHLLLISYWQTDDAAAALADLLPVGTDTTGTAVVYQQATTRLPDLKEHFGFVDGISQPRLVGGPHEPELPMPTPAATADAAPARPPRPAPDATWANVAPGEVLLGYRDQSGHLARSPIVPTRLDPAGLLVHRDGSDRGQPRDLGRGGTYLVARQLAQDVSAFRTWLAAQTDDAARQRQLAAKIVGRNQDGTPLGPGESTDVNDFGFFAKDPIGEHCPIGSHIRRANPRDGRQAPDGSSTEGPGETLGNTKRHRILRRGRAYGEPLPDGQVETDGGERGLVFVGLNADIERQFEFVQHHWLNSETFARPGEIDPLSGVGDDVFYTVPGANGTVRTRYGAIPQFVTVEGGAYFFLPRVAVLRYLASLR